MARKSSPQSLATHVKASVVISRHVVCSGNWHRMNHLRRLWFDQSINRLYFWAATVNFVDLIDCKQQNLSLLALVELKFFRCFIIKQEFLKKKLNKEKEGRTVAANQWPAYQTIAVWSHHGLGSENMTSCLCSNLYSPLPDFLLCCCNKCFCH